MLDQSQHKHRGVNKWERRLDTTESAKNVFLKPNQTYNVQTTVVMSCHNTKAADGPTQAAETTASQQKKKGVIDRTSDKGGNSFTYYITYQPSTTNPHGP